MSWPLRCVVAGSLALASACASTSTTSTTSTSMGGAAQSAKTTALASDTTGKFVWFDLITDNLPAVRKFYGELLGWEFAPTTRAGLPYVVARNYGRLVAGFVPVAVDPNQSVSQWIAYRSVANVDNTVDLVVRLGGRTLVAPVEVPGAGRAAVVADPQGAPFGLLWLKGGDPPDAAEPTEGSFFWTEYLARDPGAAATFYMGAFGYDRTVSDRQGTSEYIVLSRGRARAGILQAPKLAMRPTWVPYIITNDPAALAARVPALGGHVLLEPRADIRNGSLAVVLDPSGAIVAFQKYPAASASPGRDASVAVGITVACPYGPYGTSGPWGPGTVYPGGPVWR